MCVSQSGLSINRFLNVVLMFLFLQHLSYGNGSLHVDAAFQQTLWSVAPICSGSEVAQGTPVFVPLFLSVFFSPSLFLSCLLLFLSGLLVFFTSSLFVCFFILASYFVKLNSNVDI